MVNAHTVMFMHISSALHTCETNHGIKMDKTDMLVTNVCIEFCFGGRQLYMGKKKKKARQRDFAVFAATAVSAAPRKEWI